MSDTTRNDALTSQLAGCSDALHLVLVDELSRNLETELAAVRQDRDAVLQSIEAQRKVFKEDSDMLEKRLSKAVCELAAVRQERDKLIAATSMGEKGMLARIEALQSERDKARRQVEAIIAVVADNLCPPNSPCVLKGEDRCIKCWSTWDEKHANAKPASAGEG